MLAMAQVQYIKHLRDREDKSIAEVSQTAGIDWRTAKKYADRKYSLTNAPSISQP